MKLACPKCEEVGGGCGPVFIIVPTFAVVAYTIYQLGAASQAYVEYLYVSESATPSLCGDPVTWPGLGGGTQLYFTDGALALQGGRLPEPAILHLERCNQ